MRRLVTICVSLMALTAALLPASTAAAQDLAVERTVSMPAGLEPIGLTVAPAGVPGAGQIYVINFGLGGWELTAFRPDLTIAWRTGLTEVTIDPDSLAVAGPGTRRPGAIYVALGSRIAVFDSAGASIPSADIPMDPPTSKARWVGVYPAAQGGKVIVVRRSGDPDQDDIRWYDDNGVVVESQPLSAMGNPLVIQSAGPDQGKAYVAKSTSYDGGGKGIYTFNADLSQGADLNVQQNTFGLAASAQDPVLGSYLYVGGSYKPGGFDRRMRLTVMPPAGPWVTEEEQGYSDTPGDASLAVSGNSVPGASRVYQAAMPEGGAVRTVISIRTLGGTLRSQLEIPSASRGIAVAGETPANAGSLYSVSYHSGTLTAMVPPPMAPGVLAVSPRPQGKLVVSYSKAWPQQYISGTEHRTRVAGGSWSAWQAAGPTSAVLSGLRHGQAYEVSVRSRTAAGYGDSRTRSFTYPKVASKPRAFAVKRKNASRAVARWKVPRHLHGTSVVRYVVRHKKANGKWTKWRKVPAQKRKVMLKRVAPGAQRAQVRAVTSVGNGKAATARWSQ